MVKNIKGLWGVLAGVLGIGGLASISDAARVTRVTSAMRATSSMGHFGDASRSAEYWERKLGALRAYQSRTPSQLPRSWGALDDNTGALDDGSSAATAIEQRAEDVDLGQIARTGQDFIDGIGTANDLVEIADCATGGCSPDSSTDSESQISEELLEIIENYTGPQP